MKWLIYILPFLAIGQIEVCNFDGPVSFEKSQANSSMLITPTSAGAGIGTILTLTNDFFGQGAKVLFQGASGYFMPLDSNIISSTDSEIKCRIPSQSRTGKVKVMKADGTELVSNQTLTIRFSHYNWTWDIDGDKKYEYYRTRNVKERLILYYTNLSQSQVSTTKQAMEMWSCQTGIDWDLQHYNGAAVSGDGISTISMGDSPGTASTSARWEWCNETSNHIRAEGDIIMNSFSFKIIAHELGHRLGLGHVSQSSSMMYPTTSGSSSLSADDIEGAILYNTFSNQNNGCGTATNFDACSTLSVKDYAYGQLLEIWYYDLLGRKFKNLNDVSDGIYIKEMRYENGIERKKLIAINHF